MEESRGEFKSRRRRSVALAWIRQEGGGPSPPLVEPEAGRRRTREARVPGVALLADPRCPAVSRSSPHPFAGTTAKYGTLVFHLPRVKSGHGMGALPAAMEASESGVMTLMVTES